MVRAVDFCAQEFDGATRVDNRIDTVPINHSRVFDDSNGDDELNLTRVNK